VHLQAALTSRIRWRAFSESTTADRAARCRARVFASILFNEDDDTDSGPAAVAPLSLAALPFRRAAVGAGCSPLL
jgi:hypothetical protein